MEVRDKENSTGWIIIDITKIWSILGSGKP
jgi:hypothetical protein